MSGKPNATVASRTWPKARSTVAGVLGERRIVR
jgi:hypothetical protein